MSQRARVTKASAIAIAILILACADPTPQGSVSVAVDSINRTERIRNSGQPPRWALRELVELGAGAGTEHAGPLEFTNITGVIADAEHNIYVAEQRAREIRVFNERGQLVRRFGREGAGPGEFRSLQSIGWVGDTLAAMDAGNARIGLLNSNGVWLGQRTFAHITGNVRLQQTAPAELYSIAFRQTANTLERVFVRQTPAGDADSMSAPGSQPARRIGVTCSYRARGGDALTFFNSSFEPMSVQQPAPARRLLAYETATYQLLYLEPPDTVRILERDLPRITITDHEWSREVARFRFWYDSLPPDRKCQPAGPQRPPAKSLLRAVFFDDQNRTWVERRNGPAYAFDVFDANGRLLAQMDAPARHAGVPVYVRGDRLYLVATDSLDVQFVKAFQIMRVAQ
jgi:hypothetical protein